MPDIQQQVCDIFKPTLSVGDSVIATIVDSRHNTSAIKEGMVVDVVVGYYFAACEMEVDYLVRYDGCCDQWVKPHQIVNRLDPDTGEWRIFKEGGAQ